MLQAFDTDFLAVRAAGDTGVVDPVGDGMELVLFVDCLGDGVFCISIKMVRTPCETGEISSIIAENFRKKDDLSLERKGEKCLLKSDRRASAED